MKNIRIHKKNVKNILRRNQVADPLFASRYSLSPYRGCEHNCSYCDGRAEKYFVEGVFEEDIIVRENILEVLEKEVRKFREKGVVSLGSGVSDAYQQIEKKYELTRKSMEILIKYDYPIFVMTKSDLLLRDLEILSKHGENNRVIVTVSLSHLDEKIAKIMESGASTVEKRLEILEKFKKSGCETGVMLMPILPFIGDDRVSMEKLIRKFKELKVDFILGGNLTLRPGIQKNVYMEKIKEFYPNYLKQYEEIYKEERLSGSPIRKYSNKVYKNLYELLEKYKIPFLIPHRVYRGKLPLYDEINVLLNHMVELYSYKKIDITKLKQSQKIYTNWLMEEKKKFNRKRSMTQRELEEKVLELFSQKTNGNFLENEKLYKFLNEIIFNSMEFDYIDLKLIKTDERTILSQERLEF